MNTTQPKIAQLQREITKLHIIALLQADNFTPSDVLELLTELYDDATRIKKQLET